MTARVDGGRGLGSAIGVAEGPKLPNIQFEKTKYSNVNDP